MEDLFNYRPNPYLFQMNMKNSKKNDSPNYLINKDWEVIDENLENFDVFNNDLSLETTSTEVNKYQGLMSFAKFVEQNEKKTNPNWIPTFLKPNITINLFNSPLKVKTNRTPINSPYIEEEKQAKNISTDMMNQSIFYKTNNFNILFPPRFPTRRNSDEINYFEKEGNYLIKKQNKTLKRKYSYQTLSTFDNLLFLDQYIHEYMSRIDFNEIKAEGLRKVKLAIQEIFKNEQYEVDGLNETPRKNANILIKPRRFGPWGEIWEDKTKNIAKCSPYGHFPSYQLRTLIIKGGDDLRQELIAMQIIKQIYKIFKKAELSLYLRPYDIIVTSSNSGIIGLLYFVSKII